MTVISGRQDIGVLYGTYRFLSLIQTHKSIENLFIVSSPKIDLRILNHWDNLDRTIEKESSEILDLSKKLSEIQKIVISRGVLKD